MPGATPLGFEQQDDGSNTNVWGDHLNAVIAIVDEAIRGIYSFALSGTVTLDATNFVSNQARRAILNITGGSGGTVVVPDVSKFYVVINAASGDVTVKGSGTGSIVKPGEVCPVVNDGVVVKRFAISQMANALDMGSHKITSVTDPTNPQDAATKQYADDLAFTANAGILPGQPGNAGKMLTTDGATASWHQLTISDLANYASDQAAKTTAATALAVAMAVAL